MATQAEINVTVRLKRRWVLSTYANVAACFVVTTCPECIVWLSGPQFRVGNGKWKKL